MPDTIHNTLLGSELHEAFHAVGSSDPGAIGANQYWLDTSLVFRNSVWRRNAANTGWIPVASEGAMYFTVAAATAPDVFKQRADFVCDGTADQIEVNAAIAALPATGGKVVCVGDFSLSSPILVNRYGVTLEGVGIGNRVGGSQATIGTRFKAVSGLTGQVILVQETANDKPCYGTTLRDFTIDGGYIGTDTDGILFRANRSRIDNVHVHRCTGWGIHVRGYTAAERDGIVWWDTYDTTLGFCQVADCYNTGVRATSTSGGGVWFDLNAPDCHLLGSVIYNNYDNLRIGSSSEQITSNHFYDSERYNIWLDSSGSRTKIIGNKVEGSGQHGLFFDNTSAGTSAVQVVGNNFKNSGDSADNTYDHINIVGASGNGHTSTVIAANTFTKDSATENKSRHAINMSSAPQGLIISDNAFGSDSHYGSTRVNGSGSGSNPVVFGTNSGYKTRAGGTVSVSDGGTISHGLGDSFAGRTPTRYSVVSTVAGVIATVSAVSATTLTINLRSHDGTTPGATTVAWTAEA